MISVPFYRSGLPTNQQVRADAHSTPALQLDDLVFDSTSLALASDHQASAFRSTILVVVVVVVVVNLFQSDVFPHCSSGHLHH